MTQQDKELLLKDLCGRLPYGVKVLDFMGSTYELVIGNSCLIDLFYEDEDYYYKPPLKPYLRPMSSITKEERNIYHSLCNLAKDFEYYPSVQAIDYLYSIHIDIHWLIPNGLALEAPEGMYKEE